MAELADAHGSGPCGSNTMRVQVPFSARYKSFQDVGGSFLLLCSHALSHNRHLFANGASGPLLLRVFLHAFLRVFLDKHMVLL